MKVLKKLCGHANSFLYKFKLPNVVCIITFISSTIFTIRTKRSHKMFPITNLNKYE